MPSTSMDHTYVITESPRKLKRDLDEARDTRDSYKKKVKSCQQQVRRLTRKIDNLNAVVDDLQEKNLISTSCAEILEKSFSGIPLELMKRVVSQKTRQEYDPLLKSFALTLNFYSAKAYNYVRETFDLNLPHPTTIRRWYSGIDGSPGFTQEAFNALKERVKTAEENGKEVVCALMLDEMAIRKHVSWDGSKMTGFVDMGTGIEDDSAPIASEALVLMAVAVNDSWKVPVGYFLINGLTGKERANLVRSCIEKLTDVGVKVVSLTCDGPSCHFTMLKELGASTDLSNLDPSFPNPGNPAERVFVLLDACHMLKLVRNTLASCGIIVDGSGKKVEWQYLLRLHELQEKEGLHLANKLRSAHISWQQQKMKVNLAAQTLSSSVADALHFCRDELCLPEFVDSDATCTFIEYFDHLFDLLNSRNPFGKLYKAPMKVENEHIFLPFLEKAEQYIRSLKDPTGKLITSTQKKTAFVGFLMTLISVKQLYLTQVKPPDSPLSYLLTYKLSQDHLELFFAGVRSSGGFNNNPTVQQFSACYRRMIARHQIKCCTGNCVPQDSTSILHCTMQPSTAPDATGDMLISRRQDVPQSVPEDDLEVEDLFSLSFYKEAVVGYIAGYVVKMVKARIHCEECCTALAFDACKDDLVAHSLISMKDRGRLIKPSESVVIVCRETEKYIQKFLTPDSDKILRGSQLITKIANSILPLTAAKTFQSLTNHMFDCEPLNNHVFALIKCISACYSKIRLHHLAVKYNEQATGKKLRKTLGKLILFKHQ